jgi:polyphosphate kinase
VLGVVTVPRALPRLVPLPSAAGRCDFIMLHKLIESQVERMFRGYELLARAPFRVTRNSNLYLQEEESRSVLESVRAELHNRRKGDAVRMEIENSAAEEIVERLRTNFELDEVQVFRTKGPVNLLRLMHLYGGVARPELKFEGFQGRKVHLSPKSANLFDELRTRDILLHHPFDSYATVEDFVEAAVADPAVVSMEQTLYRTSEASPLFTALTEAAQTKEVTVVVELMARFDEASNIRWARDGRRGRRRLPRYSRVEDALQAGVNGAPRSRRRGAAIRASGHGQLQLGDGALLHRRQPADGSS